MPRSVRQELIGLALPTLLASLLKSLDASVNQFWVGHFLGNSALAATSNVNAVLLTLFGMTFGLATASTMEIARHVGAKDVHAARKATAACALTFLLVSIATVVPLAVASRQVLLWLGTPALSLSLAVAYLRTMLFAVPAIYLYGLVVAALRAVGDGRTPLYFLLGSVAVDMALNPVFIFGFGPFPAMGIAGSALATVVAQNGGLVCIVAFLYAKRHPLRVTAMDWGASGAELRQLARLIGTGIPMTAQLLINSLQELFLISVVDQFGVIKAAAYGAMVQIWNYVQMPPFSAGTAVIAMMSQRVGSGLIGVTRSIVREGILYSIMITAITVMVLECSGRAAVSLFLPSGSRAILVAAHLNREASWSFVALAEYRVLYGAVNALGATWVPVFALGAVLAARIAATELLVPKFAEEAVWWSFSIAGAVNALCAVVVYFRESRVRRLREGAH